MNNFARESLMTINYYFKNNDILKQVKRIMNQDISLQRVELGGKEKYKYYLYSQVRISYNQPKSLGLLYLEQLLACVQIARLSRAKLRYPSFQRVNYQYN